MHFFDPNWKLVCVWHDECDDNPNHAHRFEWERLGDES
jgi:hypothetical protein